ncbi:MAG: hypothetical protein ACT4PT_10230 [Methanobacteriota archaeon]
MPAPAASRVTLSHPARCDPGRAERAARSLHEYLVGTEVAVDDRVAVPPERVLFVVSGTDPSGTVQVSRDTVLEVELPRHPDGKDLYDVAFVVDACSAMAEPGLAGPRFAGARAAIADFLRNAAPFLEHVAVVLADTEATVLPPAVPAARIRADRLDGVAVGGEPAHERALAAALDVLLSEGRRGNRKAILFLAASETPAAEDLRHVAREVAWSGAEFHAVLVGLATGGDRLGALARATDGVAAHASALPSLREPYERMAGRVRHGGAWAREPRAAAPPDGPPEIEVVLSPLEETDR